MDPMNDNSAISNLYGYIKEWKYLIAWCASMTFVMVKTYIEHRILWKRKAVAIIQCKENRKDCRAEIFKDLGIGDKQFDKFEARISTLDTKIDEKIDGLERKIILHIGNLVAVVNREPKETNIQDLIVRTIKEEMSKKNILSGG